MVGSGGIGVLERRQCQESVGLRVFEAGLDVLLDVAAGNTKEKPRLWLWPWMS